MGKWGVGRGKKKLFYCYNLRHVSTWILFLFKLDTDSMKKTLSWKIYLKLLGTWKKFYEKLKVLTNVPFSLFMFSFEIVFYKLCVSCVVIGLVPIAFLTSSFLQFFRFSQKFVLMKDEILKRIIKNTMLWSEHQATVTMFPTLFYLYLVFACPPVPSNTEFLSSWHTYLRICVLCTFLVWDSRFFFCNFFIENNYQKIIFKNWF